MDAPTKPISTLGKSGTVGSGVILLVEAGKMVWAHKLGDAPWPTEMPGVIEVNLITFMGSLLALWAGRRSGP